MEVEKPTLSQKGLINRKARPSKIFTRIAIFVFAAKSSNRLAETKYAQTSLTAFTVHRTTLKRTKMLRIGSNLEDS